MYCIYIYINNSKILIRKNVLTGTNTTGKARKVIYINYITLQIPFMLMILSKYKHFFYAINECNNNDL